MKQASTLFKRVSAAASALSLIVASASPLILSMGHASAAQMTNRSITIGSSKVSQTDVTYSVSFKQVTAATIKGIVIDFCNSATGPLIGTACTAPTGMDTLATTTLVLANQVGISGFAIDTANSTASRVIITKAAGTALGANTTVSFDLGSSGASDGITNSSTNGTFYGRILSYTNDVTAQAYTPTVPGSHSDDGGVALSLANQLTTNAKVQEQLQFCVGATDIDNATSSIAASCAASFSDPNSCVNTVNLGVVDNTTVSISPVPIAAGNPGGGNACNGAAMVRTNAANGVTVSYFAEADGTGTNHTRALRVVGATCTADATPSTSNTDQCFNSQGSTQGAFSAGTEKFGVTVAGVNCGSTTSYSCVFATGTYNMTRDANYDGDGSNTYQTGAANGFAWEESSTAKVIASSTGVVDDEALILKFAAASGITTPTGAYSVVSTYVATSTF